MRLRLDQTLGIYGEQVLPASILLVLQDPYLRLFQKGFEHFIV